MVPIFPVKLNSQWRNDSADVNIRAAKEQKFYDHYGSDSIVGFFRFIQAVSELLDAPTMLFDRLSSRRFQQHRVTLPRPR